jgi:hypothetical protein
MRAKPYKFPRLNHTRPLIAPLLGASAFSVVCALVYPELGLNLVADSAALWFGLFVVEVAVEKGRADARRPAHRAMVDDLVRLRGPVDHILMLLLLETARPVDAPTLQAALKGEGDVAKILSRRRLTTSPAPMMQLGVISGGQLTWWQVIHHALSPDALRLEVLIARYIGVADAPTLAALQGLEVCIFSDVLRGRISFDDDIILEVFWRSLIQSLAALDQELYAALDHHADRAAVLGSDMYVKFVLDSLVSATASSKTA